MNNIYILVIGLIFISVLMLIYKQILKKIRIIEDLPTSSIKGVFIGLVEIKGTAETENEVRSKFTSKPCVSYAWGISEHWEYEVTTENTDKDGNTTSSTTTKSGWTEIEGGIVLQPFYLKDETGVILINPEKAELEMTESFNFECTNSDSYYYEYGPPNEISDSTHKRRFFEKTFSLHEKLYIVGQAKIRNDVVAPEIIYDPLCPFFIISSKDEKQINSNLRWNTWGIVFLGFLIWIGTFWLWEIAEGNQKDLSTYLQNYWTYICTLSYFAMPLFIWIFQVFNSMVDLRNRTNRAWSLIDIELKRRTDLLPKLFECIKGISTYEKETQTTLTILRNEISKTENSTATSLMGQINILAEAYPNLKSSKNFSALMHELSNTEDRIALARNYFNEAATWQNTRVERIPEGWIARLAGVTLAKIWNAEGFERSNVNLNLKS